jgi:UDP-2,4-diacetamido-2,4,6-trideoxy-beta-L-altropyranose hydrolase
MTGPRIVFLPDYGPAVGGGHVMRSLTLAQALTVKGARCAFAVQEETAKAVRAFGWPQIEIWPFGQWQDEVDVAVLDNYGLTVEDERDLQFWVKKIVSLDDIGREHDCDLVIDPGYGRTLADYPGRAKVLAGPAYALLRPEFTRTPVSPQAGRVLVSLGLTDVGGITQYVVARLVAQTGWSAIDVVVGSGAQSVEFVRELSAHDPRVSLHVDTRDMAGLMAKAQLAIGAGGSSVWERACMGLPSLLLVLADNQAGLAKALADVGAVVSLDIRTPQLPVLLDEAMTRLLSDGRLRSHLSAKSADLCDGQGAVRVADAILALLAESGALAS